MAWARPITSFAIRDEPSVAPWFSGKNASYPSARNSSTGPTLVHHATGAVRCFCARPSAAKCAPMTSFSFAALASRSPPGLPRPSAMRSPSARLCVEGEQRRAERAREDGLGHDLHLDPRALRQRGDDAGEVLADATRHRDGRRELAHLEDALGD